MVMLKTTLILKNRNDADILTMKLGSSGVSGKMDDVEITVLLCDVCDEKFDSIQTVDPERNIIPVVTVKENGIINGGDLRLSMKWNFLQCTKIIE